MHLLAEKDGWHRQIYNLADSGKKTCKTETVGRKFFFKRGESDRGSALRIFTTIAAQMISSIPALIPLMAKALDKDPSHHDKSLKQFHQLIFEPFSELQAKSLIDSSFVFVIDALDECEQEEDTKKILSLFAGFQDFKNTRVCVLVMSRTIDTFRLPNDGRKLLEVDEI